MNVSLCDLHAVCVSVHPPTKFWMPERIFMELSTSAHLNGVFHEFLPSFCVSACVDKVPVNKLLGNNFVKKFPRQQTNFQVFSTSSVTYQRKVGNQFFLSRVEGVEYLHRSPASRRRRRKGNPVPGRRTRPTPFLGDINMGTRPSRLVESRIRNSKIWSRVPRESEPRMTMLTRPSSNWKRQTRPLVTEVSPHQLTRNCQSNRNLGLGPRWGLDTKNQDRQADWPSVVT
jgi:hypothetical protein